MSNDGFIDKAGEAARKIFGSDEQAVGTTSEAGRQRPMAADYPMGGDAEAASHYGAQGGQEVRVGGQVTSDRGQYDDDPHYHQTRTSHRDAFDRDYHDYRREHASADAASRPDFASWHKARGSQPGPNSRAIGESASQGSDGPHILDRSFSGTYDEAKD